MSLPRISVAIIALFPLAAIGQPNPVVESAKLRQDGSKTLILEYRQTSRVKLAPTAQRPAAEVVASADNRIVIDGSKVRIEDNNPALSNGPNIVRNQQIHVFDGTESRTLFPIGITPDTTPIAIRHAISDKLEAGIPEPVYLQFRGLDPAYRLYPLDTWKATGRTAVIEGANCTEFELQLRDLVRRAWFDPSKGNAAVRIESGRNGHVSHRTTITYRNEPTFGWVPSGWVVEDRNPDGSPKYVRECVVTRLAANEAVDPNEFQFVFSPGTNVHDQVDKKEYRVLEDGSLREYTAAELFGSPKRLTTRQWLARNAWTIVLIASLLLLCLLPILIRRRTRPVTSPAA